MCFCVDNCGVLSRGMSGTLSCSLSGGLSGGLLITSLSVGLRYTLSGGLSGGWSDYYGCRKCYCTEDFGML